jgi:hypothetical protein
VQRNPRLIRALLAADAFFVRALIRLGLEGRRLSAMLRDDPKQGVKELSYFAAGFVRSYHAGCATFTPAQLPRAWGK